jgi:hypothetical protein
MLIRLNPNVSTTATEYGSVVLDEAGGEYFQLNPAGTVVLQGLLSGQSPPEVAAVLAGEFEVSPEQAEQDVLALLSQLREARLVEVTP